MAADDKFTKVNRRSFLKTVSIAGTTGLLYPIVGCGEGEDLVTEEPTTEDPIVTDQSAIQAMVDAGIKQLTGQADVSAAWQSIMPNLSAASVIAIKVNCRSSALPTHPEVTDAVVEGLKQMTFSGVSFPENNIHIYDNYKAYFEESGYTVNDSSSGVRCYSVTDYSNQSYDVNGNSQRICTLVNDTADYLINIGVLKNHASMAGVTLCMKNHFGTCDNPRAMHINYGDPYIGALNALEPIKSKQCINILDAIYGAHEGGPYGGPTFTANKILMSQDIVAIDYLGRQMLDEQGSSTVSWATYVDSAADYGLGTNDPARMEIVNIKNPSGSMEEWTTPANSGQTVSRVVVVEDDNASGEV